MTSFSETLENLSLDLAWSLWGELGVRGVVGGRHGQWSVDPEPLLGLTARVGRHDPRLVDEALDWAIAHDRYISRSRLRTMIRRLGESAQQAFGPVAATLEVHTRGSWPGATDPLNYVRTGKSSLAPLTQPSLVRLRLRALVGVGARAEIMHAFVASPEAQLTSADLARQTGFTKRSVAEELDRLDLAGLFQVAPRANQFVYRLHDRSSFLRCVGSRPRWFPQWEAMFRVIIGLIDLERQIGANPSGVQAVELDRFLAQVEPDLETARFPPLPRRPAGRPDPDGVRAWAHRSLLQLSLGRPWTTWGR